MLVVKSLWKILAALVLPDLTVADIDYSQYVNLLYVFLSTQVLLLMHFI